MIGNMTAPEAIAVLGLLMAGADEEIKLEEINSMLTNPFFVEHISDKIGNHKLFLKHFNEAKQKVGTRRMELLAVKALKSAFPALQIKTVALLTLIADADGYFDQKEKELVARVAMELGIAAQEVEPEIGKMRNAIKRQVEEAALKAEKQKERDKETPAVDNKSTEDS